MTSSENVTAGDRFGPFHACQEISMVLPRRILRHADMFSLPKLVYAALILTTLFRQNILELPLSAVRSVRPRADVRGWRPRRQETCLMEGSALLSSCLPPLPEAQP